MSRISNSPEDCWLSLTTNESRAGGSKRRGAPRLARMKSPHARSHPVLLGESASVEGFSVSPRTPTTLPALAESNRSTDAPIAVGPSQRLSLAGALRIQ
jgi:hypothetical protein